MSGNGRSQLRQGATKVPPHRVVAVSRRINKIAQSLKHCDDPRSIDQIRADVFLDLLSGVNLDVSGQRAIVSRASRICPLAATRIARWWRLVLPIRVRSLVVSPTFLRCLGE